MVTKWMNGVEKEKMSTMDTAFCVMWTYDVTGGKAQLLKHCTQKKHKEVRKHTKDKSQAKLTSFTVSKPEGPSTSTSEPRPLGSVYSWWCNSWSRNFLVGKSSKLQLQPTVYRSYWWFFRKMFPDSKIAENFKLSHKSASYIIGHGLLPHFTKVLISDLSDSQLPFSVHFDETTSSQVKKQMDLTLPYWSPVHREIWTSFYTSLFFGHAEGEVVWQQQYMRKC